VVCNPDDGVVDVVVDVGAEVVAGIVKRGRFHNQAAIFGADIEAGADLVGDSGAVHGPDVGVATDVEGIGFRVVDRREKKPGRTALDEWIPISEVEAVDVSSRNLLEAVVNVVVSAGVNEMLNVLVVLVIELETAMNNGSSRGLLSSRRWHEAGQRSLRQRAG
jgi:hypothetical protein